MTACLLRSLRLRTRAMLAAVLVLWFALPARGDELADFQEAVALASAQYRVAMTTLETRGREETSTAVQRFRQAWQIVIDRRGSSSSRRLRRCRAVCRPVHAGGRPHRRRADRHRYRQPRRRARRARADRRDVVTVERRPCAAAVTYSGAARQRVSRREVSEPQLHPLDAVPPVDTQRAGGVHGLP